MESRYKCKNLKLFLIEEVVKDEGCGEEDHEEVRKEVIEFTAIPEGPKIVLHALLGSSNPKTIKIKGKIVGQWATILIDSGSIHNFVDTVVARKVQLPIEIGKNLKVLMANRDQLLSEGLGQNVKFCI